jgi:hypothetical protein
MRANVPLIAAVPATRLARAARLQLAHGERISRYRDGDIAEDELPAGSRASRRGLLYSDNAEPR